MAYNVDIGANVRNISDISIVFFSYNLSMCICIKLLNRPYCGLCKVFFYYLYRGFKINAYENQTS